MIVMKFGGSSVADVTQIEKVRAIVQSHAARKPIVVSSAHKGITNALVAAAQGAANGERTADTVINKQKKIAAALGCAPELHQPFYQEIRDMLRGIRLVGELSPRSLDTISSFGERMSVRAIADYFCRNGVKARAHDVWDLGFVTNDNFGKARPLPGYEENMRAAFAALPADEIPVVTGFVGKTQSGVITTVGRNGSDLTATLIAAALGAEEAQVWSDTDGVMTANPSVVPGARNIPAMRFDEAAELAFFGSRVLHPATLLPAMAKSIPVRVMNTNRPDHPGTVIDVTADQTRSVTSIAYKENQSVVTLTSPKMVEQSGVLAKAFGLAGDHGVIVDVLSTSEVSVSFTTHSSDALDGLAQDLAKLGQVSVAHGKTILVVVGQRIAHEPGTGAKILGAVAEAGVNVEMLSHAMGSINFSMVIDDADINKAVTVLHDVMFEDR